MQLYLVKSFLTFIVFPIQKSFYSTRNQALQAWFQNSRCGGILIQNGNQNPLHCAIVFDCIDCVLSYDLP